MKAPAFDYERPTTLGQAVEFLDSRDGAAKVLAGGQSLGPMLNLRLVTPELLVDVTRVPELLRVDDEDDAVVLGACVTHAAIEDGDVTDGTRGVMPRIARGIAYRAVRNRGTVGGSLAHADPSADWLPSLGALGATVLIFGACGRRAVAVSKFMVGAFETVLAPDEIIEAVRIPKLSARAQCGFYKVCRKPGEFAEAMVAVLWDPERDVRRAMISPAGSIPFLIEDLAQQLESPAEKIFGGSLSDAAASRLLGPAGLSDPYALQIHRVALRRALGQVHVR